MDRHRGVLALLLGIGLLAAVAFGVRSAVPTRAVSAPRAAAQGAFEPPAAADLGPVLALVPPGEPGERLVVTGRLLALDGTTPLAERRIGVYQTDTHGNYGQDPREPRLARLNGWLSTDSRGRYEIRTIRPGAYPQGGTPEHIHFVIETLSGFDGSAELRFEDDPRVSSTEVTASRREGRFGTVRPVTRDRDGVLRVERDLRVQ
jgi:protocatechuate 3,4-dioxygenase beta subunit